MRVLKLVPAVFLAACVSVIPPDTPAPVATHDHECPPATIGLATTTLSTALREKHGIPEGRRGAVVTGVIGDSPADRAGIVEGDVIVTLGGSPLKDSCQFDQELIDLGCDDAVKLGLWREDDVEVVSVVPVTAATLYEERCNEREPLACYFLGLQYRAGYGHPADEAMSEQLLQSACDDRLGMACGHLAGWRIDDASEEEIPELIAMMERGCDDGYAPSCVDLGFAYSTGTNVERDDEASIPFYTRGCELGDAQGCYNLGLMLEQGRGVEQDDAAAIAQYEDACAQGAPQACTNAGYLYERGRGAERQPSRAFELYYRGCIGSACVSTNAAGCLNWGRAYRDGIGVGVDKARAAEIFSDLCDDGKVQDHDREAASSVARACSLLGSLVLDREPDRGVSLYQHGCDAGDAFGCYNLAVLFSEGTHVAQSDATSADYFGRACELEDGEACYWLSTFYASGKGVERDEARSRELVDQACSLGYEKACIPRGR